MNSIEGLTPGAMQEALAPIMDTVQYVAAAAGPYPVADPLYGYELPPNYHQTVDKTFALAHNYLTSIIPGIIVEPLSNAGASAVVMHDGTNAYKIMRRQTTHYPQIEDQAITLTLLSQEGIAPQLRALIDTPLQYRANTRKHYFGLQSRGAHIPRTQSTGALAVLITEQRDIGDIAELPEAKVGTEFNKFVAAALRHQIIYNDCEFHYDRKNDAAVVVDVGEVHSMPRGGLEVPIIQDTFNRFLPPYILKPSTQQITDILAGTDDLDRLHPLLLEYRTHKPT